MSWSFAHKDGLGVISEVGDNQHRITVVTPGEVAQQAAWEASTDTEITIDEARRRMREAEETVAVTAVEGETYKDNEIAMWHDNTVTWCCSENGIESIHLKTKTKTETVAAVGSGDIRMLDDPRSAEETQAWLDETEASRAQNAERVAVLWTETKRALNRATRGDLIGEYTDTCRLYEKYLGDGMYRLTYCIDGYDDASFETSATVEGKTELFNWIELKIPTDVMLCTTPKRWMVAPGDSLVDGYSDRYNDFGSVCRCGAPEAYDYRGEYRCTKCGFDPMEV